MNSKPKLIILGAGFGGTYTIQELKNNNYLDNFDVTLIDRNNYFLFTPLLHEVASGNLDAEHIVIPLRQITDPRVKICIGEIKKIDLKNKQIKLGDKKLDYDYLVIATGGVTLSGGVEGINENTYKLKTIIEALRIKFRVITNFEKANLEGIEKQKELLTFNIVGAGTTGVELVAEIAEFVYGVLIHRYHNIDSDKITVNLISSDNTILRVFSKTNQKKVTKQLEKMGVNIMYNTRVTKIEKSLLTLGENKTIKTGMTIWTAGILGAIPYSNNSIKLDKSNRGVVNEYLQVKNHKEVFIIGDSSSGNPADAQLAVSQASTTAKNLNKTLTNTPLIKFEYKPKGLLASIGGKYAVGEIKGHSIAGRWVWFLWRTIYLFKMITWRKRITVATNWTLNLFSERDTSRIDF